MMRRRRSSAYYRRREIESIPPGRAVTIRKADGTVEIRPTSKEEALKVIRKGRRNPNPGNTSR